MKIKNENVTVKIIQAKTTNKCGTCKEYLVKAEVVEGTKNMKNGSIVYYCYKCV